jgi:uncharacterized metal-binding protein YceD (DUF177 family)
MCVVTLEPFESEVSEDIEAMFASPAEAEKAAKRYAARPEDQDPPPDLEEPPDPIVDGRIDLGALAVEFFVLGLDPYPRKPGVEFADEIAPAEDTKDESPFAALAKLKAPKGE